MVVVGEHHEGLLVAHEPRGLAVAGALGRLGEGQAQGAQAVEGLHGASLAEGPSAGTGGALRPDDRSEPRVANSLPPVSFADAVDRSYRGAVELPAFARWSVRALAPHGFTSANALPLVGVCRDELLFPFEQAVHDEWGPAFDLSSLAGLLFLGRSGRAAAAQHAPGLDGRRRFVGFVAAHIGITGDGAVGRVHRPGQQAPSTACGALVALRDELAAGPLPSPRPGPVAPDPDDIEMGLLRAALTGRMTEPVTEIVALTELALRVATDELSASPTGCCDRSGPTSP